MGMFDSLAIEVDGKELEVQTKRFDRVLGWYRVGDFVDGAAPGVRAYFDLLGIDDKGSIVYYPAPECARIFTLFAVFAHGVFVDYQIRDGKLAPREIERQLLELAETWQDSARLQGFLVEQLHAKQRRIETLGRQLARIDSVIKSARRLQAGEQLGELIISLHEEQRKLDAGENPLDVIAWVLKDEPTERGRGGAGATTDTLEDYRL